MKDESASALLQPDGLTRLQPACDCQRARPRLLRLLFRFSLFACLIFIANPEIALAAQPKRVLIVYAENRLIPAIGQLDDAIRTTLQRENPETTEIFVEFLDATRFPGQSHEDLLVDYLQQKYRAMPPDVVIAVRAWSLGFLARHRAELFPHAIIVHALVPLADAEAWNGRQDITGVPIEFDPLPIIDLGFRLHPQTKRVILITGATQREKDWTSKLREQQPEWHRRSQHLNGITVEFWSAWLLSDILTHLSALPSNALVICPGMWQDSSGQWFVPERILSRLANASTAPVYGMFSSQVGSGIVGTYAPELTEVGHDAAETALRILHGEVPSSLNLPKAFPNTYLFDWRQVERWAIPASQLPPGSIVLFRDPTPWERFRWIIVIASLLLLIQTALIVALLLNRRRRRLAESASRTAENEARELRHELAHTGRVLVMGELSGTLAHELNQPLAAILSNAQAAMHFLNKDSVDIAEVKDILEDIVIDDKRAGHVIERLRALLKKRSTDFQQVNLNGVVEDVLDLTKSDLIARGVTISKQFAPALPEISGDRIQLQQVVLNLIRNASDAMSGNVRKERIIRLATTLDAKGFACLSVSDLGTGLPPSPPERVFEPFFTTKIDGLGIGLPICRGILKEHGGEIWAANNPGRGATFYIALPTRLVNEASA